MTTPYEFSTYIVDNMLDGDLDGGISMAAESLVEEVTELHKEYLGKPEALPTIYHALFDLKDEQDPRSPAFYALYETLQKLGDVMFALGIETPHRFDASRKATS